MKLRVGEIAEATGVGVDTVRFYQARGLIPAPRREGRFAFYDQRHVDRIRRIRALRDAGFRLAQIRQLLELESEDAADCASARAPATDGAVSRAARPAAQEPTDARGARPAAQESTDAQGLLGALAARTVGSGTLSRAELAAEVGVPEALIAAAVQAGFVQPIEIGSETRFSRSDLEMLRVSLEILGLGLPLGPLLELASTHARQIGELAERAIDVFDDAVRKPRGDDEEAVRRVFEQLLPRVTQVVALHFQRTVVARALERLRARGDDRALETALEATRSASLEVQWR